jgi:two-component system LytT family sensor kinase
MVQSKSIYLLTGRQKWELGAGLAIIYLPLRIYMNVQDLNQAIFFHKFPLWIFELTITVIFFSFWIIVIEWLQHYIAEVWGESFLDEFKFFNQLFTLLIAIGLAVMFNVVFSFLWHWMEAVWDHKAFGMYPVKINDLSNPKRKANNSITVMALMAAYYLAANKRSSQKLQQVHINEERLEKENIKAHFNALKNQVSPHFLFNNFSVLTTLVETNQELSIEFIARLSKAYRYILEQSDFEYIKLRTEIEFLETYMFLLKTRFEDKLKLDIRITSEEMDDLSIVPLTLQLLIENAVKHNRMSANYPLTITIYRADDFLIVSNPIQLREASEPSTKLGLQNIINRYRLLIDKPVLVIQEEGKFVVKIPLIQ